MQPRIRGRDERNFSEFPLCLLVGGHATKKDAQIATFKDLWVDPVTGKRISRQFSMSAELGCGLPTIYDVDVLLGLVSLHEYQHSLNEPIFEFRTRDMLDFLGWKTTGQYYQRIAQALDRWYQVQLRYQRAWYDKKTDTYGNAKFRMLTRVDDVHHRTTDAKTGYCVTWDTSVFSCLQAGGLRDFDFAFYQKLQTPIAKQMYRFLGRMGPDAPAHQSYNLREFVFNKLALAANGYKDVGQIKKQLAPSFEILENANFIQREDPDFRYRKVLAGDWEVHIRLSEQATANDNMIQEETIQPNRSNMTVIDKASDILSLWTPRQTEAFEQLLAQKVSKREAKDLVDKYDADYIFGKVAMLGREQARRAKAGEKLRNPAGWLVMAIKKDYPEPDDVVKNQQIPEVISTSNKLIDLDPDAAYVEGLTDQERDLLYKEAYLHVGPELEEAKERGIANSKGKRIPERVMIKAAEDEVLVAYRKRRPEKS